MSSPGRLGATLLGLVLAAGACSGGGSNRASSTSAPPSPTASRSGGTETRPPQEASPGKVLATYQVTEGRGSIRVDLLELKQSAPELLTLRFRATNVGGEQEFGLLSFIAGGHTDMRDISLVDDVGKKRYLVVVDAANSCYCTDNSDVRPLQPGQSEDLYAVFPLPPTSVRSVTVVMPKTTPIANVPIAR